MSNWDDEKFSMQTPPNDIPCKTCKFKLQPVHGQDRYSFSICDKFSRKPTGILWGKEKCPAYEREITNVRIRGRQ